MAADAEYDHAPVPPAQLQPARYFAANYAGEHVAGTEFVIGAAFVAWGVSAQDVILGLLVGNAAAVLTWALICAPISVNSRLTLYALLQKIAGPGFIKLYSIINGIMFAILAGAMITVSASAVRIPFGIEPQTLWVPTDPAFVVIALAVGAVVVTAAALGFRRLAQFAGVVVPWMIAMFLVGALALLPALAMKAGVAQPVSSLGDLWTIAQTQVWIGAQNGQTDALGLWHIAAFAWVCNLAMHGSLGDMTLLRFARRSSYGYFSALGMFIGHFAAWIFAGAMGAGAGIILNTSIVALDAGEVAYQALGVSGILAVIIAGWTTSNPTLYRAGLAFQSINPRWSRRTVTIIVGVATSIVSCFPFVFTKLLGFVGLMGLTLAPVGAIIIVEYWFFRRLGLQRFWTEYSGRAMNWAALASWIIGLGVAYALNQLGLHLFFLLTPVWIATTISYVLLASMAGARKDYPQAADAEAAIAARRAEEQAYLASPENHLARPAPASALLWGLRIVTYGALAACLFLGVQIAIAPAATYADTLPVFQAQLLVPTLVFMIAGALTTIVRETQT